MDSQFYKITAWGRTYNPQNWFYDPLYLTNRIYYIIKGTAYYKDDTVLHAGHMYIFKADEDFRVSQSPDDPVDHVFFDFMLYQNSLSEPLMDIDLRTGHDQLVRLFEMMAADFTAGVGTPWQIAEDYFELLFFHMRDIITMGTEYSPITAQAVRYINNADLSTFSVDDLADQINVSNAYLIRCFKKDLNITPHKYVSRLKSSIAIAQARRGVPVVEIAEKLGFSSVAAFYTFFKKETQLKLSDFIT